MNANTMTVNFHGSDLFVVDYNGQPYTPMKAIVEGMGLDWSSQFVKLKSNEQRWGIVKITIPTIGDLQEAICMPLRKLVGWLSTIHPNKVKPELRETIIAYQNECDDVLWDHWNKKSVENPENLPEPKTKKALPGGLSLEQQDCVKALVKSRIEHLPKDKQGGAAIKCWSAIKTKFGKSYKAVEPENFSAIVSLLGRVALEGELLNKEPDHFLADSNYRAEARQAINQHLDACHAEMRAAGVEPPKWPKMDQKTVDGLAASALLFHRWIASFDPDTMKMRLTSIPSDAIVMNESDWIRYMTQDRGYIVVKKSEVAQKLMA